MTRRVRDGNGSVPAARQSAGSVRDGVLRPARRQRPQPDDVVEKDPVRPASGDRGLVIRRHPPFGGDVFDRVRVLQDALSKSSAGKRVDDDVAFGARRDRHERAPL